MHFKWISAWKTDEILKETRKETLKTILHGTLNIPKQNLKETLNLSGPILPYLPTPNPMLVAGKKNKGPQKEPQMNPKDTQGMNPKWTQKQP